MWAFTCVPSPSRNRPPVASASSHATGAVTIGLRGKATATPVRMSMSAASAAAAHGEVGGAAGLGDDEAVEPGGGGVAGEVLHPTQREPAGHEVELHGGDPTDRQ